MLIEQIDDFGFKPLERGLGDFPDVFRTAVEASLLAILDLESEFGGDDDIFSKRRESLADEFFVRVRSVHSGGVEERYAAFDGRSNHCYSLLLIDRRPKAEAYSHAAQADGGHF